MVLGFAFCATFAFAQNAGSRSSQDVMAASKAPVVQADMNKALFVKDGVTLLNVDFHDGTADANSNFTGTGYTTGVVTGGLEAHGQSYAFARWRQWPNLNASTIVGSGNNTMSTVYAYLYQSWSNNFADNIVYLCDTAVSTAENGFMMMTMIDQRTDQTGNFNSYIQLSTIDASTAGVVDVQFYQAYRKFYDFCYIDYRIGGTGSWTAVEVNVGGVDVSVNSSLRGFSTYTMPLAIAGQPMVDLRIRYMSLNSHRSDAYGYWWILDDVSVIAADADRLMYKSQEYVHGNYSIVPQGLTVTPAWYGLVMNTGANNQTNMTATIYHLNDDMSTVTEVATYNNGTSVAGEWMEPICDAFGWIYSDSVDYRGWTCYGYDTPHGTGIAMPTNVLGANYLYTNLSSDVLSHDFDTMYYNVVGIDNNVLQGGAYRWGHDNGVLCYVPTNAYIFGWIQQGDNWYVTDDPEDVHFYEPGYMVTTTFKTGETVPEGWAIRGVELVPSPTEDYQAAGTAISGVLIRDSCDFDEPNTVNFSTVNTGAGVHMLNGADFNDTSVVGRGHGYRELGQYNTVVIPFPEQPLLRPNSTYRAGYQIEEEGFFALAQQYTYYREASPTTPETMDTIIYFRNNPATKKYSTLFEMNGYQNTVLDPNRPSDRGQLFSAYNYEFQPMIHLLVGPQQEVARVNVTIECDSTDYGYVVYGGEDVCGSVIHPVEGSTPVITLAAMNSCRVLSLAIDGVIVEPYDEATETGDPNYIMLDEETARYSFNGIMGDHTVSVVFTEVHIGIDPIAANVNMSLQPNPATSQVVLNVEGVEGQLDCAIIDMSGRVVYSSTFNAANEQVIDLSNIAKGAYFVRITNNNFSKVEKLIVR